MSWNYRIIKNGKSYTIHEVHYTKGKPTSWTEQEVSPSGETLKEFYESVQHYTKALSQPVLIVKNGKLLDNKKYLLN